MKNKQLTLFSQQLHENVETYQVGKALTGKLPQFTIGLKDNSNRAIKVKNSEEVAKICRECYDVEQLNWHEKFIVVCLNRANNVIGFFDMAKGGLTGVVADPRIVAQVALLCNACYVIISHNHPSGALKPSQADEHITRRMKDGLNLFDIKLIEHIIITDNGYFSFADEGLL